jgi:hypothetical protein
LEGARGYERAIGRCIVVCRRTRLLGCPLWPCGAPGAPDVVALCSDASKDGLWRDGRRDGVLHTELKLFAEKPTLRARASRESCAGLIEAHSKQLLRAALEEIRGVRLVRCMIHRSLGTVVLVRYLGICPRHAQSMTHINRPIEWRHYDIALVRDRVRRSRIDIGRFVSGITPSSSSRRSSRASICVGETASKPRQGTRLLRAGWSE